MILPEWNIYLRDISQAYTQSDNDLHRKVFVKPVPEFCLSSDTLLRVDHPLYGIFEHGWPWFVTYHKFHKQTLSLTPAAHDLCLMFTKDAHACDKLKKPAAVTCLQTDDSLFLANAEFEKLEKSSSKFQRKPLLKFAVGSHIKFNGIIASRSASSITLKAVVRKRYSLKSIKVNTVDKGEDSLRLR